VRQAITTKHLGPTNHRGSRIKATCEAGSLTLSRSYELNASEDHKKVALALVAELGWGPVSNWVGGGTKSGYVFVDARPQ
jgi:hypothetical protein